MPQRTVFLGTSGFAATVLRALAATPHRPALVVTPPDRRQGRGRRMHSPPAADAARELDIEVLQAEDVNRPEAVERINATAPDVGVVAAFGQIIREPLLHEPEMLNVHPSLLPRWRGAAPIERALMAGDEETGVTIMRLTEGLDSGPVAVQAPMAVEPADDHGSLEGRLAALGGELLARALDLRETGELTLTDQDDELATYAEKIAPEERRLDPARRAGDLERVVRALSPHMCAYVQLDGDARLGVRQAAAVPGELEPGRFGAEGDRLLLGTTDGALDLALVQPPGGRPMPADAYLRGHGPPERAL